MFKFQQPEDQTKFALPLNRETEKLYYNTRLIIDSPVLTEPRAWMISKINRTVSRGIVTFTATQELFNQFTDIAEYDENGNVIAWWANYNKTAITPEDSAQEPDSLITSVTGKITFSGKLPQIRVGGSKTFTISFYEDDALVEHSSGEWSFEIDGESAEELLSLSYPADNKVKVKFKGDDSYIGKILTVKNVCADGVTATADIEIIAL